MHLKNIDLNLAVSLHALLIERSVTRAAARVGLSQSAMSHTLARLRNLFDDPLLVRSGHDMVPTPRAIALEGAVQELVLQAERVFQPQQPFNPATLRRNFRIEMSDAVLSVLLAQIERELLTIAPNASMTIVPVSAGGDSLAHNRADVVIGTVEPGPGLSHEALFEDHLVCICAIHNPLANQPLSLVQLAESPHLAVLSSTINADAMLDRQLALYGLRRRITHTLSSHLALAHLVARSRAMAIVPARMARALASSHALAVLAPPITLDPILVSLWWHNRNRQDPEHQVLRESIVRAARDMSRTP